MPCGWIIASSPNRTARSPRLITIMPGRRAGRRQPIRNLTASPWRSGRSSTSTSLDGAVEPRAITGGVCYCCKTAVAAGANGSLFAAWRHVYPGNIRDIAFASSRDGGKTFGPPLRVSEDKWVLEGCPDDGPAMAVDAKNRVHIVWPTLITEGAAGEPTIALFYAMSADGTRFTARKRIPTEGMPHHPQIAIGVDGSLTMAWDEGANGKRRAAAARTTVDAAAGGAPLVRTLLADAAVYPVVAAAGGATIAAWTSSASGNSTIQVRRLAPWSN